MRIASSTVNESSEADSDLRAGASLAPAVTRAAAILDVLAEHPGWRERVKLMLNLVYVSESGQER